MAQITINKLITKLDLNDNIRKLGRLRRKQMAEHMSNAEVFVQCSTVENHSSTMREAMNVGIPCIVSDVGSASEYILHNETGYLFRCNESEVLAYYIIKLFSDNNLRLRLGKCGRDYIRKQYNSRESKATIDIYTDILET